MRFFNLLVAATAVSAARLTPRKELENAYEEIEAFTPEDDIAKLGLEGLAGLIEHEESSIKARTKRGSCSLFNVNIRRDWYVIFCCLP